MRALSLPHRAQECSPPGRPSCTLRRLCRGNSHPSCTLKPIRPCALRAREYACWLLPPQVDPGVLDAPVGCVTVAFMNVVGAQTLLSWNADVAQQAIKIFHTVVGDELKRRKGYLVSMVVVGGWG